MKKSNIRIPLSAVVMAALALGVGNANAFGLNIYGVGHMSLDNNNDGSETQLYVASNSSRLGFNGDHGLGNDMKVLFQYESGVDLSGRGTSDGNGAGTANNLFSTARDSYVGVSGGFGSVLAGRLGVLNQWLYDFNLFADQVGDLGNIWGGSGLPGRANGAITYVTPELTKGLDGLVVLIPENGTADGDALVLKLNFNDGKGLKVSGAIANVGQGTGNSEHEAIVIIASYAMGETTFGGGYQIESDMGGISGADRDSLTFGASHNLGNGRTVKAQYTTSDADIANIDATQIALGFDYSVNKATTVYVAYASTSNDSSASFPANNWGHGQAVLPAAGEDPNSISAGIVYKFDAKLVK